MTAPPSAPALAFTHVTVIDVTDGTRHPEQTVLIRGPRIQAVGPTAHVQVPAGAQVVDARGRYLIPGLWDMELYLGTFSKPLMGLLVANGVTGFRHLSPAGAGIIGAQHITLDSMVRWRREVAAGTRVGPRILIGSPEIGGSCTTLCTPARVRELVDSFQAAGADHIVPHGGPFRREVVLAMLAQARRRHIPVVGHPLDSMTLEEASDSGFHAVDHMRGTRDSCSNVPPNTGSVAKCTALAARLRRNGTWVAMGPFYVAGTPARLTDQEVRRRLQYWPRQLRAEWVDSGQPILRPKNNPLPRDFLAIAERAKLPMLLASDVGANPGYKAALVGFRLHDDLAMVVEHGLAPLTALQAVTLNAAGYLNGTDSLGTVAAGKLADLVLLEADPLVDIYNTQRIRAVVANGRYYDRAALDTLLREAGAAE